MVSPIFNNTMAMTLAATIINRRFIARSSIPFSLAEQVKMNKLENMPGSLLHVQGDDWIFEALIVVCRGCNVHFKCVVDREIAK